MLLFQNLIDETQMPKPQKYTDIFILTKKLFWVGLQGFQSRAQPDWAYKFPDRTTPNTQICWTGPARLEWIRTHVFNILTSTGYQFSYDKVLDTNLVSKVIYWDVFENKQKNILKKKL